MKPSMQPDATPGGSCGLDETKGVVERERLGNGSSVPNDRLARFSLGLKYDYVR